MKNQSIKGIKNIKNNTTLETLTKKDIIYKKFTYYPWVKNKYQKIFKDSTITLASINKSNIKNLIKAKDEYEEPPLKKSGIYKINCKHCEKVYIGQR